MRILAAQGRRHGLVVYQLVLMLLAVALLIGLLLYVSRRAPAAPETVTQDTTTVSMTTGLTTGFRVQGAGFRNYLWVERSTPGARA
ncbi:MAG TPA: hypothetical protein VIQ74_05375 [Gemmatimonadaceae bacterium]